MDKYIDVAALTRVLVISLVVGAGIPAVFALGVKSLAPAEGSSRALHVSGAVLCFGICLVAVAFGIIRLTMGGK